MPKPRIWNYEEVAEKAKESFTKKHFCEQVNMPPQNLSKVLRADAQFAAAFNKNFKPSKIIRKQNNQPPAEKAKKAKKAKKTHLSQVEINIIEAVRLGKRQLHEIARHVGEDNFTTKNLLTELTAAEKLQLIWEKPGCPASYYLPGEISEDTQTEIKSPPIERIKTAIEAGNHLPRQIRSATSLDVEVVLERYNSQADENEKMPAHGIVVKREPTFTAYFLKGKVPDGKIILDGFGGVTEVKETVVPEQNQIKRAVSGTVLSPTTESVVEISPRFENTIKHITEHGHSGESIEKVKAELVREIPAPPDMNKLASSIFPTSSKVVQFAGGGELYLDLETNLFDADEDELEFVVGLIKHVKNFTQKQEKKSE